MTATDVAMACLLCAAIGAVAGYFVGMERAEADGCLRCGFSPVNAEGVAGP